MPWPSIVTTFTNPQPTDRLNNPSHSSVETAQNTGLTEVQTFVGTISSAAGTLIYDIRAAASNGGGHVQTANKGGTGQTSYTKGDILVGQSSSVLSKLSVGTNGYALVADSTASAGVTWGIPNRQPSVLSFITGSVFTYVKPSVFSYLRIRGVGGGGGGGSGVSGGPGGGGGYFERVLAASSVAATVQIVVGAAGATSSVGGTTAFGSVLIANGGAPGTDDPGSGNTTNAGAGGTATGGDVNITGGAGIRQSRSATTVDAPGGITPLSPMGNGAVGQLSNPTAKPGALIIEVY